ncbi:MAG: hypothetical protein ABL985_11425 [Casimicrobium sp.]
MQALRAGDAARAIAAIESAPASERNTQAVQRTLAAAYAHSGNLPDAQRAILRAINQPTQQIEAATRALAGRIALDLAQPEVAFSQFEQLVQLAPQQAAFWRYLWQAAHDVPTRKRALELVGAHQIALQTEVSTAWKASQALAEAGQRGAAITLAEQTLKGHAQDASAHWLYAKRVVELASLTALDALTSVLPPEPLVGSADGVDVALCLPSVYADNDAITKWRERYADGLRAAARDLPAAMLSASERLACIRHTAFGLAYHGRNDLELQTQRGNLMRSLTQPLELGALPQGVIGDRARIRVGFVSKHVRDCTVGHYFKRFMTDLSDAQIEVFVYACGTRDAFTDDVAQRADHLRFFDNESATLTHVSEAIAHDALDVVIYPEIGMEPFIEKLAAMRLAPLQCALWGHPVTTGLPTIDVFFSGAALEPEGAVAHYRERLQLLPGLGTCYPAPPPPSALTRAQLGLPEGVPLAVCAQSPFKWNPDFTRAVARCLRASPHAQLVVFDGPAAGGEAVFDEYLAHHFAAHGVEAKERVIRLPQCSRADFLAVLAACDLGLDTFGFSGGNTSLDAFSVGLPVVTLPGEFMRGRQTFAMLSLMSSTIEASLVARDVDDYVRITTTLLADAEKREALRRDIRASNHRLFDDATPVVALREWLMGAARKS